MHLRRSGAPGDERRRRLLNEGHDGPSARSSALPLHGSVQEHGYYYVDVNLGTPAKSFQVIVDTGSTATYVPCEGCEACGVHTGRPKFDPDASSTCTRILCGAEDCHSGVSCRASDHGMCTYSKSYAEHSSASGQLVRDVIHLGGEMGDLDFVFGCTKRESGTIQTQEADGLMGLGNGVNSLPIQLATRHQLDKVFSLCYGSFDGGGAISFGRLPPSPNTPTLQYTPLKPNRFHPTYYVVATEKWEIGGVQVAEAGDFNVGYGTVMDSGTTFTYVPTKVFNAVAAELGRQLEGKMEKIPGPDPAYPTDICYYKEGQTQSNLGEDYPTLTLTFEGGARLDLPPSNYLFIHGKREGAFCLGVMDNGRQGTLIGGITVRNTMVEYDMASDPPRVGIATTNCGALLGDHSVPEQPGAPAAVVGLGADGANGTGANATHADGAGVSGKGNGTESDAEVLPIAMQAGGDSGATSPPVGFIVLLFFAACFVIGYVYVRYYHKGEAWFPGLEAFFRHVELPGIFREIYTSVFRGRGGRRYAQFGLDEDGKRPEGEVELPPLLVRGENNKTASKRPSSPSKRQGEEV